MELETATLIIVIPLLLLLWSLFYRTEFIGCILATLMVVSWYLTRHIDDKPGNSTDAITMINIAILLTTATAFYWLIYFPRYMLSKQP